MLKSTFLFALSLISFVLKAQVINNDSHKKLEEYLQICLRTENFSGSVLVAKDGEILLDKGYGMANYEFDIPNTSFTKFRIGSLTKAFTAVMVLQLVESGKIKLDGKITDYLLNYPNKNGDSLTIHQLLSHTSGLPHYEAIPDFLKNTEAFTLHNRNTSICFPDCRFYSNLVLNINIAALAIFYSE